jgi:hypothetical protein
MRLRGIPRNAPDSWKIEASTYISIYIAITVNTDSCARSAVITIWRSDSSVSSHSTMETA